GNPGGPGNPFSRRVAELKRMFLEAVTDDDLNAVVHEIILKARNGDLAAARLLLQYALGKPAERVEPDRIEIDEHQLRGESSVSIAEVQPGFGELPVQWINELTNIIAPAHHSRTLKPLQERLDEMNMTPEERRAARKAKRAQRRLEKRRR